MAAISATTPPPVAVLPSGKTNLIALDLGARGDPIEALERLIELARTDLAPHIVARELIALRRGDGERPAGDRHVPRRRRASPTRCSTAATRFIRSACPTASAMCITAFALLAQAVPGREGELPAARSRARCSVSCRDGKAADQRALRAACGDHAREAAAVERARRPARRARSSCWRSRSGRVAAPRASPRAWPASSAGRRCAASISRKPTRSPSRATAPT